MILHLRHDEIDRDRWDAAVAADITGLPYAFTWFLDILSPQWEALVQEDYSMIFPLPVKRKAGMTLLLQPPFIQQLGIFSRHAVTADHVRSFAEALPRRIRYADIHLNEKNPLGGWAAATETLRRNILLSLQEDAAILTGRYHENTRRNLKRFAGAGMAVDEEPAAAGEIIRLFSGGQGRDYSHLKKTHYDRLEELTRRLAEKNMLEVLTVREDGEMIAGALFVKGRQRDIFYFSATAGRGRQLHALTGILDHFIRTHAGSGHVLDFEGAQAEGLARFYKGFGGREVTYPRVVINRLPGVLRWLKK